MATPTLHRNRTLDIRSARVLDKAGASMIVELETDLGTRRAFLRFAGRKTMAKHLAETPPTQLLDKAKAAVVDGACIDTYGNVPSSLLPLAVENVLKLAEIGHWPIDGIVPRDFRVLNASVVKIPLASRHPDLVEVRRGHDPIGVFERSGMKWRTVLHALARQGDLGPEAQADLDLVDANFRAVPVSGAYDGPIAGNAQRRAKGTAPTTDSQRERHERLLEMLGMEPAAHPIADLRVEATAQIESLSQEHARRKEEGTLPASAAQIKYANGIAERLALDVVFDASTTAPQAHGFIASHKDIGQLVDASDAKVFALLMDRATGALEQAGMSLFAVSAKRLAKAAGHPQSAIAGDTELQIDRVEFGSRFETELDRLEREGAEPTIMKPAEGEPYVKSLADETRGQRFEWLASYAGMSTEAWHAKVADALLSHPERLCTRRTYLRELVIRDIVDEIVAERKTTPVAANVR